MASYPHDSYDTRHQRPSRRDDSQSTSEGYEHSLRPATAANPHTTRDRSRSRVAGGSEKPDHHSKHHDRYSYDTHHHYPPPFPLDPGRPQKPARSPNRRKASWPPPPKCEDEATSLALEAGSQSSLNAIAKDEALFRGTIDQEPVIQDVSAATDKPRKNTAVPPTPPSSEDEATRKASRRPSRLNMNFGDLKNDVPEMGKRTASPYAFSKPNKPATVETPRAQFLSPETLMSPPPTAPTSQRRPYTGSKSQPSSPNRASAKYSPSQETRQDYFSLSSSENAIDDNDDRSKDKPSRSHPNKPATFPPSRSGVDAQSRNKQTSVVDFAPPSRDTSKDTSIRRLNLDARRNTDTADTLPKLRVDKNRAVPIVASGALSGLAAASFLSASSSKPQAANDFALPRSRQSSHVSSRAVSPAESAAISQSITTPPRSPRHSAEFPREPNAYDSPPSRGSSVANSRPSSPSPRTPTDSPHLPRADLDWSSLIAANAARRPNKPSRLSASLRQDSMPVTSSIDGRQPPYPPRNNTLPYPVDDGPSTPIAWMPSERQHQFFPETRPALQAPGVQEAMTVSRAASPARTSGQPAPTAKPARPSYQAHSSASEVPRVPSQPQSQKPSDSEKLRDVERPREPEKARANESRPISFNNSSQAKKDVQVLAKKGLPNCPRSKPVAGESDWYTLVGAPNLDFCPDCIDSVERTVFRNAFRKSPPRNYNEQVMCALGGSPWIRLAWLLTLQQQRTDLRLLKELAEIDDTCESCPGEDESPRAWYGVRDPDGYFVRSFRVCKGDARKIECLLPTLNGLFVPLPQRYSYEGQKCAIRPESNRFSTYLDALISTHEDAVASRKNLADTMPFVELAEKKMRLKECTRDSLLRNQLWHFIPSVPELTVCEDCFEEVVEPQIKKDKDLALRFNRAVQPVYTEGIGSSCQLYSRRMRRVFQRALDDNDIRYLTRKAQERRDAELRLQDRHLELNRKAKRLSYDASGTDEDDRRIRRELKRITTEWQREWE